MASKTFIELQMQVIQLVKQDKHGEALMEIEEAKQWFPERLDRLGHWKANLYAIKGEKEKALFELNEVLEKGLWWNPDLLTSDPELETIKDEDGFKSVVEKCRKIYSKLHQESRSDLIVQGNPESDQVLFALHWKGSNARDFALQWKDDRLIDTYRIGFPQSSQLFSHACYTWDDYELTKRDTRMTFAQFSEEQLQSDFESIIAGASQGGKVSVQMCLDKGMEEFHSFIAIVPAFDVEEMKTLLEDDFDTDVRGCIITGDEDPFYQQALETYHLLIEAGIECKWIVKNGMGHVLPEDLADVIDEAVGFVSEGNMLSNRK
ncbi:alpha/beta hydrolase [Halobacillus yeomjeoni]|uniref:BCE-2095-like N-terminal domain-containing protein n=1 Tax=Halobacillus yeomjeoni TaxID=311194 RepID=A0A931HUN1_9BACI|nr:hypothetical protein [Halobacillus yeomjeoni]MBH0229744.1 hypothetical protein [Halobacillus yeomjeoni]